MLRVEKPYDTPRCDTHTHDEIKNDDDVANEKADTIKMFRRRIFIECQ